MCMPLWNIPCLYEFIYNFLIIYCLVYKLKTYNEYQTFENTTGYGNWLYMLKTLTKSK